MDMDRRALYNLLRMNWQRDQSVSVQPWQVADYRSQTLETLFRHLEEYNLTMDRVSFQALSEDFDTPEDLVDNLTSDMDLDALTQDKIYLVIFELWRRLEPEKLCLSIFCDELDHQIDLYDRGLLSNVEELQDVLANLTVILDENTDHGEDPKEVFESISARCGNDLESFLYDYIAEVIDNDNPSYASELLDDFEPYMRGSKWFAFLKIRLIASSDMPKANLLIRKLLYEVEDTDLELNFEILAFLVQGGDKELFHHIARGTLPLLTTEEEFRDFLSICADFYHRLDNDKKEAAIQEILKKRLMIPPEQLLSLDASQVSEVVNIIL